METINYIDLLYGNYIYSDLGEAFIQSDLQTVMRPTALLFFFSVTSNLTNYCFLRTNAVTVTDNKIRHYYY